MEKNELTEIKLLIKEIIETSLAMVESQFEIIDLKLDNIQKQTEKINGRVTKLEDVVVRLQVDDRNHISNCPQTIKLAQLQKDVDQVVSSKKFILATIGIMVIIVGVISSLIRLFGIEKN